ncbi:MAG: SDR family oxidoreductase [Fimbriimonadaceae bacterium]|nr:SDR family oxidoreductase [Fimbriimonadaceae bacterium]
MIPIDLSGHLAVVTGGSGELGRAICRTLARAGADVAVQYLHGADRAAALVAELRELGVRSLAVQADITDAAAVNALQQAIAAALGDPDICVNSAVIQYAWTSVLEQDPADYEGQFRSCVLHNVLMAKAFLPAMIARRWGRFIALNTECAMQCWPAQSAYAAGKRGLDGLLRVLAKEVGEHQITVNQVAPGWMISETRPDRDDPFTNRYREQVPLRRRGHDQDIANAVLFLASDLAGFITGCHLPVSGGSQMPTI